MDPTTMLRSWPTGEPVLVGDIRSGDRVVTPMGGATVLAVVVNHFHRKRMTQLASSLCVTPRLPVNLGFGWQTACTTLMARSVPSLGSPLYDVILDHTHVLCTHQGALILTIGHGITGLPVEFHPFFSTTNVTFSVLAQRPHVTDGKVHVDGYMMHQGEIVDFRYRADPMRSMINRVRALQVADAAAGAGGGGGGGGGAGAGAAVGEGCGTEVLADAGKGAPVPAPAATVVVEVKNA